MKSYVLPLFILYVVLVFLKIVYTMVESLEFWGSMQWNPMLSPCNPPLLLMFIVTETNSELSHIKAFLFPIIQLSFYITLICQKTINESYTCIHNKIIRHCKCQSWCRSFIPGKNWSMMNTNTTWVQLLQKL